MTIGVDRETDERASSVEHAGPVSARLPENLTELEGKLVLDTRNYFISKIIPGRLGLLTVAVIGWMVGYEQYRRYEC